MINPNTLPASGAIESTTPRRTRSIAAAIALTAVLAGCAGEKTQAEDLSAAAPEPSASAEWPQPADPYPRVAEECYHNPYSGFVPESTELVMEQAVTAAMVKELLDTGKQSPQEKKLIARVRAHVDIANDNIANAPDSAQTYVRFGYLYKNPSQQAQAEQRAKDVSAVLAQSIDLVPHLEAGIQSQAETHSYGVPGAVGKITIYNSTAQANACGEPTIVS